MAFSTVAETGWSSLMTIVVIGYASTEPVNVPDRQHKLKTEEQTPLLEDMEFRQ